MYFSDVINQVKQPCPPQVHNTKSYVNHRKMYGKEYLWRHVTSSETRDVLGPKVRRDIARDNFAKLTRDIKSNPRQNEKSNP